MSEVAASPEGPAEDQAPAELGGPRALPRVPLSRSLVGSFDAIDHGHEASGWICDMSQPARVLRVELRIDGAPVAQVEANAPRPDLRAFRIRPSCGFRISLPAAAFTGVIRMAEVYVVPDGLRLGPQRPFAAVIMDHKTYPKTFSVDSILRLEDGAVDYERAFSQAFLQRHGVRAAVAYAYLWLMKRPPDSAGWDLYSEKILAGEIGLADFLRDLAASEEAQRARRAGIDLRLEFDAVLAAASRLPSDRPEPGGQG